MARWRKPSDRDRVRRQIDLKLFAHCPKNGRQVVHVGVTRGREHPVQAFAGLGRKRRQLLKPEGGVDQVAQYQSGGFGLAIEKQGGRLVQERLRKCGVTLHTLGYRVFEVSC